MAAVLLLLLFPAPWALAAGPMDEGMPGPHQPLVTRDAAPETKLEVMFGAAKSSMGRMYELALAAEYAPIHSFSVELELPLALRDPREGPTVAGPGDLALTAKVAPLMLGAQDTVVALGLTLGLRPWAPAPDVTGANGVLVASGGTSLVNNVPSVVISHGKNGAGAYTQQGTQLPVSSDADEQENSDGSADNNYVSKAPTPSFDDHILWLSQNILLNRMVTAGKLP